MLGKYRTVLLLLLHNLPLLITLHRGINVLHGDAPSILFPTSLWQMQLYHSRSVSGGSSLLNDLRGQEMNGQFHNFTRMDSDDYDPLLNLIGPN
jgi:hypothetical protein